MSPSNESKGMLQELIIKKKKKGKVLPRSDPGCDTCSHHPSLCAKSAEDTVGLEW